MYSPQNLPEIDAMRRSIRVMALGAVMETLVGPDSDGRWPVRVTMKPPSVQPKRTRGLWSCPECSYLSYGDVEIPVTGPRVFTCDACGKRSSLDA